MDNGLFTHWVTVAPVQPRAPLEFVNVWLKGVTNAYWRAAGQGVGSKVEGDGNGDWLAAALTDGRGVGMTEYEAVNVEDMDGVSLDEGTTEDEIEGAAEGEIEGTAEDEIEGTAEVEGDGTAEYEGNGDTVDDSELERLHGLESEAEAEAAADVDLLNVGALDWEAVTEA